MKGARLQPRCERPEAPTTDLLQLSVSVPEPKEMASGPERSLATGP